MKTTKSQLNDVSQILELEDNKVLVDLYGQHDENLAKIENNFGEVSKKDFIDYLYFSLTTQTTVGLDIDGFGYNNFVNPEFKTNKLTRIVNILQLVSVLLVVATSV